MGIQLSFSAAQRYMSSPMSYFLHYFMRLRPVDTGSALVFGSAVDSGLNSMLKDKYANLPVDINRAKNAFDEDFGATDPGVIKYSKADKDISILTSEDLEIVAKNPLIPIENICLRRKGHIIIDAYAEQVIPKLDKVLLVQHEISLTNELGDALIGVVDLVAVIDGKTWLMDNKTSSVKYSEDAAALSQQLGTYYEALKDEYKLDGVGYIVIPKNIRKKKEPLVPIEMQFSQVRDDVLTSTFQMYEGVLNGIKTGDFRCTRNCCRQPWPCVYKAYCDSNGTDLTGLEYVEKK